MPDGAQHVAFAYSADGKDRFTTVWPNLNLLDGTKDFSGDWINAEGWTDDGTYKDLAVKKTVKPWTGIYKTFTAPKDGDYTFSSYIKSAGTSADDIRFSLLNGSDLSSVKKVIGNNFDWTRDSVTLNLKANDKVSARYEMNGSGTDSALWTAGHKWEEGSTSTLYTPSFSEVTASDYPSYIGTYIDNDSNAQSTDPARYTWKKIE